MPARRSNISTAVAEATGGGRFSNGGDGSASAAWAARTAPEAVELRLLIPAEQISMLAAQLADLLHGRQHTSAGEAWPEWMNVDTAAGYLDCTPERIRKLVARREIPYHQEAPGCRIFFHRHELDTWMAATRRGPMT